MLLPSVAPRHARGLKSAIVAGAVVALFPVHGIGAQMTEAITRARKAAEQENKRTQSMDAQGQQAMQEGAKKTPAAPTASGAPQTGTQGGTKGAPAPATPTTARRPAPMPKASGPTMGAAEAGTPGTHTIVKGETLWGIASRYLNDPYLWPEIYRLNTDVVEDPRWIYPGEVLKLPGAQPATVATVAVAPVSPNATPAEPAVQVEQEPEPPEGSTVFSSFRRASGTTRRNSLALRSAAVVRSGEFTSSPIATPANGPAWSGRVLESLSGSSINMDRRDRAIQLAERVSVTPPSGTPPVAGTRYLVIRQDATVPGIGLIAVPTGIVDIDEVERGKAPVGRVSAVFDAIRSGQGLIPYEKIRIDSIARPTTIANGPVTTVAWLLSDPVLPTLQAYLILNPKGVGTVRQGDVFALLGPGTKTPAGVNVPEEVVGSAQVVRVTAQGITAVVTGQKTAAIKVGMSARLAARMP
jgi:LysM repeat protein